MTMPGSDDLAGLLTQAPVEHGRFSQGVLITWDPETFSNRVAWMGTTLEDLPVKSATDALTFQAGDTVILSGMDSGSGGVTQWWIDGKLILPGAGNAENVIQWMQTTLARQISAEIFADRIHIAEAAAEVGTSSSTYVGLTGGPVLENVEITDAGTALIFLDAQIGVAVAGIGESTGYMSPRITGATTRGASGTGSDLGQKELGITSATSTLNNTVIHDRSATLFIATGLNPGLHDFEAYYRAVITGGGDTPFFIDRSITVVAF